MTLPDFTINLGNGIYLDSSGKLTTTIPDGVPKFSLSQPLPIPSSAVNQVFGNVGTVVPQLEKIGAALQVKDLDFFKALGLSKEFAQTFGMVASIATTLASVIPYVNIAMALFNVLGIFGGSDPLSAYIKQEFDRLHNRLSETDRLALNNYVASCLSDFDPALNALAAYQTVISKPKAYQGAGEAERKRQEAQTRLSAVHGRLEDALLHSWALPLDQVAYHDNWGYLQDILHTVPKSGTAKPAHFPGAAVPFDHRPMVQMLVYGLRVYLTLIRAIIPEYRTTGQYHIALKSLADKLSAKLDTMRDQTLARTIYKAGVPYFKLTPRQFFVMAVGAMDLREDTDDFMHDTRQPADHPEWDRAGNLYRLWTPAPTVDPRGAEVEIDSDTWWTINPAAVELANRQSERDYAALLMRSGYFTLAHLEALMRHLATEPNKSETVTGSAETWRKSLRASPVMVRNDEIPFSPPIEAAASREPQEVKAYLTLTTQPIPSDIAIGYRVRFLTLPDGNKETPFSSYVWNSYVQDGGTRNWKLQVNENSGVALDPVGPNERLLLDGISPAQPINEQGTVSLTADTFDWYVPVPDNPIRYEQIRDSIRLGVNPAPGSGIGPEPMPQPIPQPSPPPVGTAPALSRWNIESVITKPDIPGIGWDEGGQTWKGSKREWLRNQIQLTYKLYWHEDRLSISLKSRPQDRNFVVYLVVEEFLARSQQWLRTPVQVRVNGQLTYVPQSFFDAETEARKNAIKSIGRIERNYKISRKPGPGDPVVAWLRPGIFESTDEMREFVDLVRQHAPEIVDQELGQAARAASSE